jgi:hypothetical protein
MTNEITDKNRLDWLEQSLEESTSYFINAYADYYHSFKENDDITLREFIDELILKEHGK